MRYTVYSLFFLFISFNSYAQYSVECIIKVEESNDDKNFIKIYSKEKGYITEVEEGVKVTLKSINPKSTFIFISNDYSSIEKEIDFTDESIINIYIPRRLEKLNEIILNAKKKDVFALKRMKDFEKTAIYAGKKTEVILVEQSMANLASNNARQIFNQISGLNQKLKNKAYVTNAPKEIVQNDKNLVKELTIEDEKLRSIVSSIN